MEKKGQGGLYLGVLLVVIGCIFFLELNHLWPNHFIREYTNVIFCVIFLFIYWRNRQTAFLLLGLFFLFNEAMLLLNLWLPGYNYVAGIGIVPGLLLLSYGGVRKKKGFVLPGILLTCWGTFLLLGTMGLLYNFAVGCGLFFLFTALAFLLTYIWHPEHWLIVPVVTLGILGGIVMAFGLGPVARGILLQAGAVGIVILGIVLIVQHGRSHKE